MISLLWIALGVAVYSIGSLHAGLSNRAYPVGWWSWHAVNWLRRDVLVAAWYIFWVKVGWVDLILLAFLHLVFHESIYRWAVKHRNWFKI